MDLKNTDLKNAAYEEQVAGHKRLLFRRLRTLLSQEASSSSPAREPVLVELGIGGFPNAPYYQNWGSLLVIGIEPDAAKHPQAAARAAEFGLNLRMLPAVAENLPLPDSSVDAVVSTCTLCTVADVQQTLSEVKRVLKAEGGFAFFEHVRCETDEALAARQALATPAELRRWGCRLDRRTLQEIGAAGFSALLGVVDGSACYFDLPTDSDLMSPTVLGIALP